MRGYLHGNYFPVFLEWFTNEVGFYKVQELTWIDVSHIQWIWL